MTSKIKSVDLIYLETYIPTACHRGWGIFQLLHLISFRIIEEWKASELQSKIGREIFQGLHVAAIYFHSSEKQVHLEFRVAYRRCVVFQHKQRVPFLYLPCMDFLFKPKLLSSFLWLWWGKNDTGQHQLHPTIIVIAPELGGFFCCMYLGYWPLVLWVGHWVRQSISVASPREPWDSTDFRGRDSNRVLGEFCSWMPF